jgi:hypothetical protein
MHLAHLPTGRDRCVPNSGIRACRNGLGGSDDDFQLFFAATARVERAERVGRAERAVVGKQ